MHTMKIETEENGVITLHHNSDWSGTVLVRWHEKDVIKEAWVPGVVLLAVGLEAMKDKVRGKLISILEEW